MKQILGLIVAALLIWAGFYLLRSRPAPAPEDQIPAGNDSALPAVNWQSLSAQIREALLRESPELQVDKGRGIEIKKEADLTGDGVPEVLLDAGVGGAYTDSLVLMQYKNNAPAVAQLRTKQGDLVHADSFLEGASVRNSEETQMLPEKRAITSNHFSLEGDGTTLESCEVEAYVWRQSSGLFEYDPSLSAETETAYCEDIRLRMAAPSGN